MKRHRERRRVSRKKRALVRVVWFVLAGSFLVGATALASRVRVGLPGKIRELSVFGQRVVQSKDLKSVAGVSRDTPLFGGWIDQTLTRVTSNPRVASAAVTRTATGQVVIRVSEHKAAALVNLERLYYLNAEGRVLDEARGDKPEALDLPVLTGPWSGAAHVSEWESRFREGTRLLKILAGGGFPQSQISELHFDPSRGWAVYRTGSAARVVVGGEQFEARVKRLRRVLKDVRWDEGVREIDLDFADRVVVKHKGSV